MVRVGESPHGAELMFKEQALWKCSGVGGGSGWSGRLNLLGWGKLKICFPPPPPRPLRIASMAVRLSCH